MAQRTGVRLPAPPLTGTANTRCLSSTKEAGLEPIVMIGHMGVGKTTVGRLLAKTLSLPFIDSDEQIEAKTGRTGREIAASDGVPALHEIELEVFLDAIGKPRTSVIAAAASVVDHPRGRRAMGNAICIWLDRPPRARQKVAHRRDVGTLERLERRRPVYRSLADLTLSGAGSPEDYVARALAYLQSSVE